MDPTLIERKTHFLVDHRVPDTSHIAQFHSLCQTIASTALLHAVSYLLLDEPEKKAQTFHLFDLHVYLPGLFTFKLVNDTFNLYK